MSKHITLKDKMAFLSPERQAKIKEMTQEAIFQIKLSELRKQLNLSQAELAKKNRSVASGCLKDRVG